MNLGEGLHLVGSGQSGVGLTHDLDCNVYLIDGSDEVALVDAGIGLEPERIEEQITSTGVCPDRIKYLLLTHGHGDHAGGALYFKEKYNLQVIAPEAEAKYICAADEDALGLTVARKAGYYPADYSLVPCPVDRVVAAGDKITVGKITLTVFMAAGHSPGGVCYLGIIGGHRVLFVGDLVSFGGRISLQNIPGADVHAYSESVLQFEGLGIECFLPGHNLFCVSGGQRHLDAAAAAFKKLGVPPNMV